MTEPLEAIDPSERRGERAPPTDGEVRARPIMRAWRWLPVTGFVVLLDQLSKAWIARHFAHDESLALLPVLNITLRFNTGAAFSVLADASGWQRWLFSGLAIAVSVGIVIWLYRLDAARQRLLALSLSLVLAGAVGNLIDRLRMGQVIDFIDVHWKDVHFPAFNVADSAITVGAILLLLDAWFAERHRSG